MKLWKLWNQMLELESWCHQNILFPLWCRWISLYTSQERYLLESANLHIISALTEKAKGLLFYLSIKKKKIGNFYWLNLGYIFTPGLSAVTRIMWNYMCQAWVKCPVYGLGVRYCDFIARRMLGNGVKIRGRVSATLTKTNVYYSGHLDCFQFILPYYFLYSFFHIW